MEVLPFQVYTAHYLNLESPILMRVGEWPTGLFRAVKVLLWPWHLISLCQRVPELSSARTLKP